MHLGEEEVEGRARHHDVHRRRRVLAHLDVHLVEEALVLRVRRLVHLEADAALQVHLERALVVALLELVVAVDAQLDASLNDGEHLRRWQDGTLLLGRVLHLA